MKPPAVIYFPYPLPYQLIFLLLGFAARVAAFTATERGGIAGVRICRSVYGAIAA